MALQLLVFPLCYLLGSLSPSYAIIRRTRRLDLRVSGSGHLGATDAFTFGGMWPGIIAVLGDIAKGALAAHIALVLAPQILLPLVAFGLIVAFITENMTPPDQGHLIGMTMTRLCLRQRHCCCPAPATSS